MASCGLMGPSSVMAASGCVDAARLGGMAAAAAAPPAATTIRTAKQRKQNKKEKEITKVRIQSATSKL